MVREFEHGGSTISIQKELDDLFYGKESIAHQLERMKRDYPDNKLLQALEPVFASSPKIYGTNVKTPHTIKFINTKFDTSEMNEMTAAWEELMGTTFGMQLVKAAIIQTGFQNSPMSFWNLIPASVSNDLMRNLLRKEDTLLDGSKNYANFAEQFVLNNLSGNDVVAKFNKNAVMPQPKYTTKREVEGGGDSQLKKVYYQDEDGVTQEVDSNSLGLQLYRLNVALKNYSTKDVKMVPEVTKSDKQVKPVAPVVENEENDENDSPFPICPNI
jgi:hypothetical protein